MSYSDELTHYSDDENESLFFKTTFEFRDHYFYKTWIYSKI